MEVAETGRKPLLVAVGGLMASGKSTLARALAERLDAELVSADETRRDLHDRGVEHAYAPGFSDSLYPAVLARAAQALAGGRSVVLDATFRARRLRNDARRVASAQRVPFRFVECRCAPELCRTRLRSRERATGESGWLEMFEAFLALWEPVEELPSAEHRLVDTSVPIEDVDEILCRLGDARP